MPEELRFDGRVVIVTGAGAGLGRAYALLFASRGASVVINDLGGGRHGDGSSSSKIADSVVEEIRKNGGKAVANYDSVLDGEKIVKTAIDAFGRIDIVVNNAGILRDKSFLKMSINDWDLIQDVHVKGAVKTTQAAWPYFRKQNYGRVILTTSNSGLYGNFGQANYSSAKMALVGLANTLSIEGGSNNIYTNVIVPTAASRLTEDILPPELFAELKPEFIAPVVVWMCHEECSENGSIIESAIGWAGKCHIIRSSGCVMRKNPEDMVTLEDVKSNWSAVTDMSAAKRYNSIEEVTGELMSVAEMMKDKGKGSVHQHKYDYRDVILYALGVGATIEEPSDMCYLYENHDNFSALPIFYVIYGPMGCMSSSVLDDAFPGMDIDFTRVLHGEQYLEVHQPIPTEAKVENHFTVQDVMDKGKGAVILVQCETYDSASGDKLTTSQMSLFVVGAGGFQGPRTSSHIIQTLEPPNRKPDASVSQRTSVDQPILYRLSGDLNPLHVDKNVANLAGFEKPILHGLCSLGFATRHVLQTYAAGRPELFKAVKARFTKPVLPGQTLCTDMWRNGNRIHFQTLVRETNTPVITGAYIDLKEVATPASMKNLVSAQESLESDAVFAQMADYVKSNPDQVKKINGIFLYTITSKGESKTQWTLDLKKGEVYRGEPKSKPDTTLTIEDKDMIQMALGKLNPQVAFMQGKLKIKGNVMLTQKLKTLLDANKPKL